MNLKGKFYLVFRWRVASAADPVERKRQHSSCWIAALPSRREEETAMGFIRNAHAGAPAAGVILTGAFACSGTATAQQPVRIATPATT